MTQRDHSYSGFYARMSTVNKAKGSMLMGPDNIVGDDYQIEFRTENDIVTAWVLNKFDAEVGFFDVDTTRKLQLANARDLKIRTLLSYVAYSDEPGDGEYWAQMAIFTYNRAYETELDSFVDRCAKKLGDGVRPNINLGSGAVDKIFEQEDWMPSENLPLPKMEKGNAVIKDHRSMSEKMIEQGRSRNIGCYIVSWVFIFLVLAALVYGLHVLGLF